MIIESVSDMFGDSIDVSVRQGDLLVSAHTLHSSFSLDYVFTPAQARKLAQILLDAASSAEESSELLSD